MSTDTPKHYTITQVAKICGLPESTLRYYETIGIIRPIARDPRTKRRVYSDDDVDLVVAIACLNATGLSIDDMKSYLANARGGDTGAHAQVDLLQGQLTRLTDELRHAKLRIEYVRTKITYWQSVIDHDDVAIETARKAAYNIADAMKLPKPSARRP